MAYRIVRVWIFVGEDWCQDCLVFKGQVTVRPQGEVGAPRDEFQSENVWNRWDTCWYTKGWDKSKPNDKPVFNPVSLLWVGWLHQDVLCIK